MHSPYNIPKQTKFNRIQKAKENLQLIVEDDACPSDVLSTNLNLPTVPDNYVFPENMPQNENINIDLLRPPTGMDIDSSSEDSSSFSSDWDSEAADLEYELAKWAVGGGISSENLTKLLKVLQPFLPSLPLCAKTILKRATDADSTLVSCGPSYAYFDLEKGIIKALDSGLRHFDGGEEHQLLTQQAIRKGRSLLSIKCNVDGVPLFKSRNIAFWPVLAVVNEAQNQCPFLCALYCGYGKPSSPDLLLEKFASDVKKLQNNGIIYNGFHYDIAIWCFTCDAPARSFCKGTKSYNGYSGCDFCRTEGLYLKDEMKMTFPERNAPLRTNDDFDKFEEVGHQLNISPLVGVVKMVSSFPPDYLHLICLGVMKRLLHYWLSSGSPYRLSSLAKSNMSEQILALGARLPPEFNRKGRSLIEVERWKATEFRTLLLYFGPIVLKDYLDKPRYEHFLLLHFAVYVMSSNNYCWLFENAKACMEQFVYQMNELYGKGSYVYNVHCLLHVADAVKRFGPLDKWSCFPFESFLHQLKRRVRSANQPLVQITNRIHEMSLLNNPTQKRPMQYSPSDICLTNKGLVAITKVFPGNLCDGVRISFVSDLYKYPYPSSHLGIGIIKKDNRCVKNAVLLSKCIVFSQKENIIVAPMVSSDYCG